MIWLLRAVGIWLLRRYGWRAYREARAGNLPAAGRHMRRAGVVALQIAGMFTLVTAALATLLIVLLFRALG